MADVTPADAAAPAPAAPAPAGPQAMTPPGPTGPATMAPNKQGERLQGMIMANIGVTALTQALTKLGATSKEGEVILKALSGLTKRFQAPRSTDLGNAEMKLMGAMQKPMGGMPGGGGPSPANMARDRLASLGMAGMPGGAA